MAVNTRSARRKQLMKAMLSHKYLSSYEVAERTGLSHRVASKGLADAIRDHEPLERVKRQVVVPVKIRKGRKTEIVWVYRLKSCASVTQALRDQAAKAYAEASQNALNL